MAQSKSGRAVGTKHPVNKGLTYIIVEDLPEDQRKDFSSWLNEQTTPVVDELEFERGRVVMCAYEWDYDYWYDYWIKNEIAPYE